MSQVFDNGKYTTQLLKIEPEKSCFSVKSPTNLSLAPPKPLLVATPIEAGEFSILILLHGYLLINSFYSQLIQHVASHGFIVIAPQLYTIAGPDSTEEIKSTAAITEWLSQGLKQFLPPHIQPNLNKIVLSGHSRGGKAAFALALGKIVKTSSKLSALIGIDPVDGMDKGNQTPPPVLTYEPHSVDLKMPVLVIGSGLGEVKKNPLFPPCAPEGVNHENFYNECCKAACYFVAKDCGHMDVLDDETNGIKGKATYCLCKNGKSRESMRLFVGGIMVAFLRAYLEKKAKVNDEIVTNIGSSDEKIIDEDDDWEGIERSELEKDFAAAANYVFFGDKDVCKPKLDNDVRMELYGLNKIALEGPCREPQPMAIKVSARAKWNAWQKLGNMSPEVAMEQYISLLSDKAPEWMEGKSSGDGCKYHSRVSEASPPDLGTGLENQLNPKNESVLELNSATEGDLTGGSFSVNKI